jgi:hypothetical protein
MTAVWNPESLWHRRTSIHVRGIEIFIYPTGVQTLYDKGPQPLFWAGLQAAHEKITVSGIPNGLDHWVNFMAHTYFTNVTAGRGVSLV